MSTLDRYILNAFVKNLALVLLVLISLYSLVEFLETVDDFIEREKGCAAEQKVHERLA